MTTSDMTAMMLIQAKDFREFSDLPVARRDKVSQAMGKKTMPVN